MTSKTSTGVTLPSLEAAKELAASGNAFAFDIYARLRTAGENFVFSPFSVWSALTMAWAGARGATATEMGEVLHVGGDPAAVALTAGSLVARYASDAGITLRVANRLFGDRGYAFEQPYVDLTRTAFGAALEACDFQGAPEEARRDINDWVSRQTENHIRDLVPRGSVGADTRLVLANAVYFLGHWAQPFIKEATRRAPFHVSRSTAKHVPTMISENVLRYAAIQGVRLLEMPYRTGAVAMTFVLPDAIDGLDAVEEKLSPAIFDAWAGAMTSQRVLVALPKVEVKPARSLSLARYLIALGMPRAFSGLSADFTAIANPSDRRDRLFISDAIHEAFVNIDEKGTEAAAATALSAPTAAAAVRSAPPPEFRADHPFLFFLRDLRSKAILFMGRVADPSVGR